MMTGWLPGKAMAPAHMMRMPFHCRVLQAVAPSTITSLMTADDPQSTSTSISPLFLLSATPLTLGAH